jgi:DNA-binding FadR family transcriptional regulator
MERVGLVARVEEQLERIIARGWLPECGRFGSEETLARRYGVSRGTVREALRRLAARGLVVQHPGRQTRAVALDESLTLENLGLALHDERSPGARRLLEGYFRLKQQVTVELLADCATHASEADLKLLEMACFALWDAAHWEPGERCAQREFELLKLAARVTDRPGHLLLLQSMQRAMRGMAARVLPLVDGEAVCQWAICAMHALGERDAEVLQRKLPSLLRACDERVLGRLAPVPREDAVPMAHRSEEHVPRRPAPAAEETPALAADPTLEEHGLARPAPAAPQDEAPETCLTLEQRGLGPRAHAAGEDLPGAAFANLSDSRTGFCASPPEEAAQPERPSADACGPTHVAALRESGLLHGTRDQPPPAGPHGVARRHSPPTSQESLLLSSNSPRVLLSDEGRPASDASAPTEHPR